MFFCKRVLKAAFASSNRSALVSLNADCRSWAWRMVPVNRMKKNRVTPIIVLKVLVIVSFLKD